MTRCSRTAAAPVAPSAIRAKGKTFVNGTFADISEPRALELAEIPGIIEDFKRGTANALAAGFDGVEIHGANGYLLDQFAKDGTNKRTDAYGGSIENRAKLMLEVSKVVAAEAGAERTGIRISPVTPANDISDSNPQPLFDYIVDQLNALKLIYIHVIEGATGGPRDIAPFDYALPAQALQAGLYRQQRLRFRSRDQGAGGRRGRPDRVRKAVHLQSRPGRAPEEGRAAERVRQGDVLRRRRQGIHGLSDAGREAGGGVGRSPMPASFAASASDAQAPRLDIAALVRHWIVRGSRYARTRNDGREKGRDRSRPFVSFADHAWP